MTEKKPEESDIKTQVDNQHEKDQIARGAGEVSVIDHRIHDPAQDPGKINDACQPCQAERLSMVLPFHGHEKGNKRNPCKKPQIEFGEEENKKSPREAGKKYISFADRIMEVLHYIFFHFHHHGFP